MPILRHFLFVTFVAFMAVATGAAQSTANSNAAQGASVSDTPAKFVPKTDAFDYDKREVMVPMRDGVKLKTFILVPKNAKGAPMLLDRTPYDAEERVARFHSPHMAAAVSQMLDTAVAAGYIIVFQDVRGKYG